MRREFYSWLLKIKPNNQDYLTSFTFLYFDRIEYSWCFILCRFFFTLLKKKTTNRQPRIRMYEWRIIKSIKLKFSDLILSFERERNTGHTESLPLQLTLLNQKADPKSIIAQQIITHFYVGQTPKTVILTQYFTLCFITKKEEGE